MTDEQNNSLFEKHSRGEGLHTWKNSWTRVDGRFSVFTGIECGCGALIQARDLVSIINDYYGNRIRCSMVDGKAIKGKRLE